MSTFEHTAVSPPGALDREPSAIVAACTVAVRARSLPAAFVPSTMRLRRG